jgi:hypothetical protein
VRCENENDRNAIRKKSTGRDDEGEEINVCVRMDGSMRKQEGRNHGYMR